MQNDKKNILKILDDLRHGKLIILTDHPDRENEGDLVFPAEFINAEIINFMIRNGSGIICLPLTSPHVKQLGLRLMLSPDDNKAKRHTAFTMSIEARTGVTTGVSAADRATTILTAINDHATLDDIVSPGHVFPLLAKDGGVLERDGHTEGAIDLMKLAGLKPAAVICELMNRNGTMMHGEQLKKFAQENEINLFSIEELIHYRLLNENLIEDEATTQLPLSGYGDFQLTIIKEKYTNQEHLILSKEAMDSSKPLLVRVHSSCLTGDLFGSMRCDCQAQLHYALDRISKEGGMLFYLNQEGRGIGLFNKIKAYALQEKGLDTIEANLELKLPVDCREYHIVANVLQMKQIKQIKLLTNNPTKVNKLINLGMSGLTQEQMPVFYNECNMSYLLTKKNKLNHMLNIVG